MSIEKGSIVSVALQDGRVLLGRVTGLMLLGRQENQSKYVVEFLDGSDKVDTVPWWTVEEVDPITSIAAIGQQP